MRKSVQYNNNNSSIKMQFSGIQILINYVNSDFGEFKCAKSTKCARINTQSSALVLIFNNN